MFSFEEKQTYLDGSETVSCSFSLFVNSGTKSLSKNG